MFQVDYLLLNINGFIDLAILKNGQWYIVDYKTDSQRADETQADFEARLVNSYKIQLNIYAKLLKEQGFGDVARIYICAIRLKGKLIEVPIL